MDKLCETINRQCCLHCEMECDGKWLETEIEMYKEDLLNRQSKQITDLEAKLAEMQCKSYMLYSMLYKTLENQGCENIASQINQMTDYTFEKEADWFKGNRNYDQLKQQLAEKEKEIEELNKFMSDKADEIEDLKERISNKITSAYGAELMAKDVQWHLEKEIQELKQSQNQTAIAELEKVKEYWLKHEDVGYYIDQQIKPLKGETDGKDNSL